ncbi:MAG: hypothetical protein ACOYK7_00525 [Pirellulales bacterium]
MSPTVDALLVRRCAVVVVALVGLLPLGCKPQIKLVPAIGTFTIGGKPAGNITVQFMPDVSQKNGGPTSYATTDAEGRFTLRTYDNRDGAVPGAHVVTAVDLDEERPAQGQERTRPVRLDAKYSMAAQGIRVTVEEGKPLTIDVPPAGR